LFVGAQGAALRRGNLCYRVLIPAAEHAGCRGRGFTRCAIRALRCSSTPGRAPCGCNVGWGTTPPRLPRQLRSSHRGHARPVARPLDIGATSHGRGLSWAKESGCGAASRRVTDTYERPTPPACAGGLPQAARGRYLLQALDGRLVAAVAVADDLSRPRQLGLRPRA
jgi:hypothetical protein